MEEPKRTLFIESLKNAINFGGKANIKAVIGKLMKEHPEYRSKGKEIKQIAAEIIQEINQWQIDKQKEELLKIAPDALKPKEKRGPETKELPPLPNAEIGNKKAPVVMRLAPYPSGALHIGNARMIVLNDEYIKKYKGKLILCFDDTIGATKKAIETNPKSKYVIPEAYDLILEGLDWLGVEYDKDNIIYKSDRIEIYQEYAEKFIKEGNAYVCTCDAEEFRTKYKRLGKECPCRNLPVEEHLKRWKMMFDRDNGYKEGEAVVRLKTGMDQKDPAVRDHIIMRISDAEHPRIGNKCRVWPLLDFSWAIDDHLLGVTHIIRGADLRKEGFMEEFIWDLLKWPKKEIILYGRLKFSKEFKLSKTEARLKIQRGEYDGWEDPRTWSLQSLRERGIRPQALREALIELGLSMSGINFSENWIYSKNTKLIDPIANRYWFVQDPIEIIITGLKEKEYLAHPLINPNNESLGTREVKLTVEQNQASVFISQLDIKEQRSRKGDKVRFHAMKIGDTFRLKDLFTIRITKMETTKNIIYAEYITSEPDKKIRKIQWVPKNHNYRTKVLKPDGIIWEGYAEGTVKELKLGTIIQFERYGFVRVKSNLNNLLYCYFAH